MYKSARNHGMPETDAWTMPRVRGEAPGLQGCVEKVGSPVGKGALRAPLLRAVMLLHPRSESRDPPMSISNILHSRGPIRDPPPAAPPGTREGRGCAPAPRPWHA